MAQRVVSDRPTASDLKSALRPDGKPVFLVLNAHESVGDVRWDSAVLDEIRLIVGDRFVLATELPRDISYSRFCRRLRNLTRKDVLAQAYRYGLLREDMDSELREYLENMFLNYRELAAAGAIIRPIDIGGMDKGYKEATKLYALLSDPDLRHWQGQIWEQISEIRDPILESNINKIIMKEDSAIAVKIGAGHLRHLETNIQSGNIVSVMNSVSFEYLRLRGLLSYSDRPVS